MVNLYFREISKVGAFNFQVVKHALIKHWLGFPASDRTKVVTTSITVCGHIHTYGAKLKSELDLSKQLLNCWNSSAQFFLIFLKKSSAQEVTAFPSDKHLRGSLYSWRQSMNSCRTNDMDWFSKEKPSHYDTNIVDILTRFPQMKCSSSKTRGGNLDFLNC